MKSYNDILSQYERMYHQWWDDERAGKSKDSMRYVLVRNAFKKYCKNICIKQNRRLPTYESDSRYQTYFWTEEQKNAKYPRSIYAGY